MLVATWSIRADITFRKSSFTLGDVRTEPEIDEEESSDKDPFDAEKSDENREPISSNSTLPILEPE